MRFSELDSVKVFEFKRFKLLAYFLPIDVRKSLLKDVDGLSVTTFDYVEDEDEEKERIEKDTSIF